MFASGVLVSLWCDASALAHARSLSAKLSICRLSLRNEEQVPADIPYMPSVVNLHAIFDKIQSAGTPPKFTHDFLKSTLGFGSSNDRAIIKILRQLGFLTADGTPTQRYNDYRGAHPRKVLAQGLREGWPELFLADERVYEKSKSQIQAIAKNLTGAGDSAATKMASTFHALAEKADWTVPADAPKDVETEWPAEEENTSDRRRSGGNRKGRSEDTGEGSINGNALGAGLFQLHHDIHIHLPPTNDVSVYRAIFRAIKAELM